MSLSKLRKLTEEGVTFSSHIDGSKHVLTPERSVEIQNLLGSDIVMQLDECVVAARAIRRFRTRRCGSHCAGPSAARRRSERRRGARCSASSKGATSRGCASRARANSSHSISRATRSAGLAVGEPQGVMLAMIETVEPHLPQDRPRYLMGVGTPDDIVKSVQRGVDMFDCVMPTRAGRHGQIFTRFGRMNLKNAKHAEGRTARRRGVRLPGRQWMVSRLSAPSRQSRGNARQDAADLDQPGPITRS